MPYENGMGWFVNSECLRHVPHSRSASPTPLLQFAILSWDRHGANHGFTFKAIEEDPQKIIASLKQGSRLPARLCSSTFRTLLLPSASLPSSRPGDARRAPAPNTARGRSGVPCGLTRPTRMACVPLLVPGTKMDVAASCTINPFNGHNHCTGPGFGPAAARYDRE
jgi:hypothetical protein